MCLGGRAWHVDLGRQVRLRRDVDWGGGRLRLRRDVDLGDGRLRLRRDVDWGGGVGLNGIVRLERGMCLGGGWMHGARMHDDLQ